MFLVTVRCALAPHTYAASFAQSLATSQRRFYCSCAKRCRGARSEQRVSFEIWAEAILRKSTGARSATLAPFPSFPQSVLQRRARRGTDDGAGMMGCVDSVVWSRKAMRSERHCRPRNAHLRILSHPPEKFRRNCSTLIFSTALALVQHHSALHGSSTRAPTPDDNAPHLHLHSPSSSPPPHLGPAE